MALHIAVWSDVACPWCYVGKRRLESALRAIQARSGKKDAVNVEWKSFELDPRTDHADSDEAYTVRLAQKYGTSSSGAAAMVERMTLTGAEEGLAFDFETAVIANTFDAHRLLQLGKVLDEKGKTRGLQTSLKETFMRAHFEEGADLGSHDTLLRLASDAGLDPDKASAVLGSDDFSQEVRDDEEEAQLLGITGVPFFAIGRFALRGAQKTETIIETIEKALQEESADPLEDDLALDDDLCFPEGC